MNVEAIREVMHRNRPFTLKAADGSEYFIRHPDFISVGDGEDELVAIHAEGKFILLDLFSITAVELTTAEEDASAARE